MNREDLERDVRAFYAQALDGSLPTELPDDIPGDVFAIGGGLIENGDETIAEIVNSLLVCHHTYYANEPMPPLYAKMRTIESGKQALIVSIPMHNAREREST